MAVPTSVEKRLLKACRARLKMFVPIQMATTIHIFSVARLITMSIIHLLATEERRLKLVVATPKTVNTTICHR